jgi:hypothetical protein
VAKEKKKKNLVMGPKRVPDTKRDRPLDCRSQHKLTSTNAKLQTSDKYSKDGV